MWTEALKIKISCCKYSICFTLMLKEKVPESKCNCIDNGSKYGVEAKIIIIKGLEENYIWNRIEYQRIVQKHMNSKNTEVRQSKKEIILIFELLVYPKIIPLVYSLLIYKTTVTSQTRERIEEEMKPKMFQQI